MRPFPLTDDDPCTIGGHRLLARLGSGGMGTVYLARTPTGRTVALKAVHAALAANPDFTARFQRETDTVRALGDLEHVPSFVGAGTDRGRPWLATAYVVGPSLAQAVTAHGLWTEQSVRALGAQLVGGLAALHASGVVHRDLKPSNILLTPSGPRLVDFGIARTADADHRTGEAPGTPAYMAPEQLAADGRDGPPCDVYALASVLTYTACGRPPFGDGEPGEVLYRITHEEPELTLVPDELRPLLADCLRRDPDARPALASVAERIGGAGWFGDRLPAAVLGDLAAYTARTGEAPPARVTGAPPDAPRLTRRGLLTGVAAVALAGAGGTVWAVSRTDGEDGTATAHRPTPATSRSRDPDEAPSARWEYTADFKRSGIGASAVLVDGTLIIPAYDDRQVFGIDARTGTPRWIGEIVNAGYLTVCGSAAVMKTGGVTGRLAGIEASDGRVWHSAPLGVSFDLLLEPVFAADPHTVYAVGHAPGAHYGDKPAQRDRYLLAYDVTDRRLRWRRRVRRSAAEGAAGAVADGVLVFLENDEVTAYRATTGAPLWSRTLSTTALDVQYNGLTQRTAADGTAVVAGRGVLCLDLRTGRTLWSLDPEDTGTGSKGRVLHGGTTIDGTTIYLTALGKDLAVLRREDRHRGWTWKSNRALIDKPAPPPLLAAGYVFPQTGGVLQEDAVAVDLHTHKTAWTLKTVDAQAAHVTLLTDSRSLYVLRGTRLRAYPLTG
ncbi:protein kinase domain-containing protein [Streptomyces sp. NPDC002817]|uniref:protein kinase domain-containing protein n=1 Tax=Streptomyces sp. NPDC088357 TaxID=3154655 RepID=UPI0034214CA4